MYSLEEMYRITGDNTYSDLLERVAYNALPTQITDDGNTRQYYHQINQVEVTRKQRNFSTPHQDTDILFGILTGYPCCTCNLHQAWPKLVQNLWLKTADGGVAAMIYAPSKLSTTLADGTKLIINEKTCYPFEEQICFEFSLPNKGKASTSFPFELRIPEWSDKYTLMVNGVEAKAEDVRKGTIRINRTWEDGDKLTLTLSAPVRVSRWYDNAAVVERGALVYALRMEERWRKHICQGDDIKQLGEYYYEVTSSTPWNVALQNSHIRAQNIEEHFIVEKSECSDKPWSLEGAPIKIKAKARVLPQWTMERNSAGDFCYFTQQAPKGEAAEEVAIELIPFGCTTLRVTEFPVR